MADFADAEDARRGLLFAQTDDLDRHQGVTQSIVENDTPLLSEGKVELGDRTFEPVALQVLEDQPRRQPGG